MIELAIYEYASVHRETHQDMMAPLVQMFGLVQTTLFRGGGVGTRYSAMLLYGAQKMPTKMLGKRATTKMLTIRKVVRCEVVLAGCGIGFGGCDDVLGKDWS